MNDDFSIIVRNNKDNDILLWLNNIITNKNGKFSDLTIIFNKDDFLKSVTDAYSDSNSILKQFVIDFNRINYYFNDIKITELEYAISILSTIKCENKMSGFVFCALLCCQSSFYYSFLFLHKNLIDSEYYKISDRNDKEKIIKLYFNDLEKKITKISMATSFKIVNTDTGENVHNITTEAEIDLNYPDAYLIYKVE